MPRSTFVLRDGQMVDKETGEPMNSGPWRPVTPMVEGDYEGYQSPVTGKWVEGKRARRYDLESNGCIDARELKDKPVGKFKNKRFAKKHGLPLAEEVRD